MKRADAIVTVNEVIDRHGTGVILDRIFGRSKNILSIRSRDLYGEHRLGREQLLLPQHGLTRAESYARVLYALNGSTVARVLCVPYEPDELVTSIALKELFGAPMGVYVMDDNNIYGHDIPDDLMGEALRKADLRLAISPEMRDEYEKKFGYKFFVVPPVVNPSGLQSTAVIPSADGETDENTGVLVGSLWSAKWLARLRRTVKESGLRLHWYGNARVPWLNAKSEELREDGIIDCGFIPERELTERVRRYRFAVVPSGTLDEGDDRPEIARLSLPTRLPYLVAASGTPIIVLGNARTAAARFLERFGVGQVCSYDGAELREAAEGACEPAYQAASRRRAASHSTLFSAEGLDQWIWRSLESGEPCDNRFERAFERKATEVVPYIERPAPKEVWRDFVPVYHALRRLKGQGFAPDFVLDVGSSTGVWSDMAKLVFPGSRFILIDPLHARYARQTDWYFSRHPEFECVAAAVADQNGEAELKVTADLYGSSMMEPEELRACETVRVPVRTLDGLAQEKNLKGRGLLKIDVQFAEHLVLGGARRLLLRVDALLLELSLVRYSQEAILFRDMCDIIEGLGFRYYEDVGGWRCPVDGTLLQKDVLFVRENRFLHQRGAVPIPLEEQRELEWIEKKTAAEASRPVFASNGAEPVLGK